MQYPSSLHGRVTNDGAVLSFRGSHPATGMNLVGIGIAVGGGVLAAAALVQCIVGATTGQNIDLAAFVMSCGIIGVMFGLPLGLLLRPEYGTVSVRPGAVCFDQVWHPVPPSAAVTLHGEPEGEVRLAIGDRILATFSGDNLWDNAGLTALAREVARVLDVPFTDHRDQAHWQRWATSTRYRAQHLLPRMEALGRVDVPKAYELPSVEPEGFIWTHDGLGFELSGRGFLLTATTLFWGRQHCAWPEVDGVALVFDQEEGPVRGTLWLGVEGELLEVGTSLSPDAHQRLIWSADALRAGLADARHADAGTHTDIPSALRRVQGARDA